MSQTSLVHKTVVSELNGLLAAAKKEWILFRRYPSWVIAFFIWPVLFPLGFVFTAKALSGPGESGVSAFGARAGTTDYVSYLVVGSTMWMWLNITLWDVGFRLRGEQMRGTLESNWLCPVWRISIILGSSLTNMVTSLFFLGITALEFRLIFGVKLVNGNVGLLLLVLALVVPSIYGLGLAFASLVVRFKEANAMVFLVRGIFMVFCGITYPLTVLPEWMEQVASLLPLTYAIRDIRAVVLSNATFGDLQSDLLRLGLFAVMLPVLGLLAFYHTERRSRKTGALSHY